MTLKMLAKMFTIIHFLKCWATGHLVIISRYALMSIPALQTKACFIPNISVTSTRADFHFFFNRRGGKILGGVQALSYSIAQWVQVICNMPFLMLWEDHEMAN